MKQIHVVAGLIAIVSGFVALFAAKGSPLHRRSGDVFVVAMLVMSSSGALMAALKPDPGTAFGGVLTFYLVATATLAVRRSVAQARGLLLALGGLALLGGLGDYALGAAALRSADGRAFGYPAALYFVFGSVALLGAFGDARLLRTGALAGVPRLVRHIGRMGFAMFMATASLFLGQPRVFPEPLRQAMGVRAIPVLVVIGLILYWLARVRTRRLRAGPLARATT